MTLHVISLEERTALFQDDKLIEYTKTDYLDSETMLNLSHHGFLTEPLRYYWGYNIPQDVQEDFPKSLAEVMPFLEDRTEKVGL